MGERGNNRRGAARMRKMRSRSQRLIAILFFIVCLTAAVFFGFFLRGQTGLLQQMGFPASITGVEASSADAGGAKKDTYNSLSARLGEVEDVLAADSLDTYSLDAATDKTLTAFAESTDDPNARYYSPERYSALLSRPDEGYAGVGVLFSEYDGQAYAVDVFEGSQAQDEGVRAGDFVVAINGDNSQTWTRNEVASVLSQSAGSNVVITWRRPESLEASGGQTFTTTLECREYDEVNVSWEYYEDRTVGSIQVKQITQNVSSLVKAAIDEMAGQGARAFVLDIRNNPGGFLNQAVDLASLFMSGGTVVEVQTVDGVSAKAATGEPATDLPLVVLVNKDTCAGAEVVAAALKESQRATLVGETTMGKGTVQVNYELTFGGAIRYTAARYLTPEGHEIDNVGVSPEIAIAAGQEGDGQLDYALSLAGSMALG